MHVRISKKGWKLLNTPHLASAVIEAIHSSGTDFRDGKEIKVQSPDGYIVVRSAMNYGKTIKS